ncbi:MAG: hypothetical protein KatS3mg105_0430 [Gemmatales bacterium]|nr:MAG: hypothetical protein KatS3mg105_0430 [Gemmatales bacterium]
MPSTSSLVLAKPAYRFRQSDRVRSSGSTASVALSVVIVNYRQWGHTFRLVRSLRREASFRRGEVEIIVVDNCSPGKRHANRLRRMRGIALRRWRRNYGYARAVNEGCRLGKGNWFLLLNPDIDVDPGFLDDVVQVLSRAEARTGVVGFHLRNRDGSRQLSTGPFPTLVGSLLRLFQPRCRRKYDNFPEEERRRVPWATGCCALIRRKCLDEVGGFDERFFLYYEDVDFCLRASQAGWNVMYEPAVRARHLHPLHRSPPTPLSRLVTRHAFLLYAYKHWPRWQFSWLKRIIVLEANWHAAYATDQQDGNCFRLLIKIASLLEAGRIGKARKLLDKQIEGRSLR